MCHTELTYLCTPFLAEELDNQQTFLARIADVSRPTIIHRIAYIFMGINLMKEGILKLVAYVPVQELWVAIMPSVPSTPRITDVSRGFNLRWKNQPEDSHREPVTASVVASGVLQQHISSSQFIGRYSHFKVRFTSLLPATFILADSLHHLV